MPTVSGLVENGIGRPFPDCVGKAEFVTSDDGRDSVTMNDFIKKLGVTQNSIKSVFKGLYEPDSYKVEKGKSHACYLISGVNKVGTLYNSGAIFRRAIKDKIKV